MNNEWLLIVPTMTEAMLVVCCVMVWRKLRELGVKGVSELTLGAVVVDTVAQGWRLWERAGEPAGVGWLFHVMVLYLMVYVVWRLGGLLWKLKRRASTSQGRCVPAATERIEVG